MARPEDPRKVVVLVVVWVLVMVLSSIVVRRDERRLDREHLERAWPPASRDSALIGLSLLLSPLLTLFAVAYHFARTRRFRPKGLLLGIGWTIAILVCIELVATGVAIAIGLPLE